MLREPLWPGLERSQGRYRRRRSRIRAIHFIQADMLAAVRVPGLAAGTDQRFQAGPRHRPKARHSPAAPAAPGPPAGSESNRQQRAGSAAVDSEGRRRQRQRRPCPGHGTLPPSRPRRAARGRGRPRAPCRERLPRDDVSSSLTAGVCKLEHHGLVTQSEWVGGWVGGWMGDCARGPSRSGWWAGWGGGGLWGELRAQAGLSGPRRIPTSRARPVGPPTDPGLLPPHSPGRRRRRRRDRPVAARGLRLGPGFGVPLAEARH